LGEMPGSVNLLKVAPIFGIPKAFNLLELPPN
jgi:hypothetical protein